MRDRAAPKMDLRANQIEDAVHESDIDTGVVERQASSSFALESNVEVAAFAAFHAFHMLSQKSAQLCRSPSGRCDQRIQSARDPNQAPFVLVFPNRHSDTPATLPYELGGRCRAARLQPRLPRAYLLGWVLKGGLRAVLSTLQTGLSSRKCS